MTLTARRMYRLSGCMAVALATAYGFAVPLPYLAPILALHLTATRNSPIGPGALVGLVIVLNIVLGCGLVLTPILQRFPVTGLVLVAIGLLIAFHLIIVRDKEGPGMVLVVGLTLITLVGQVSYAAASEVVSALVLGASIAVISQWVMYAVFPDPPGCVIPPPPPKPAPKPHAVIRAVVVVFPMYLLALTNPLLYMPTILKTVAMAQESSTLDLRSAGQELFLSTLYAGMLAILFWFLLGLYPSLWMFFWLMVAFGLFFAARIYRAPMDPHTIEFWVGVATKTLVLLGPSVSDSENGSDVYAAFAMRMSLFMGATAYVCFAFALFELRRPRRVRPPLLEGT